MSIDTIARQASRALTAATGDLDADRSLRRALARRQRRRMLPVLVAATAVAVLVVGWVLGGELHRSADPAPPASPSSRLVGRHLDAPASARVPAGWDVVHDRAYVEMRPSAGTPGVHIFMLVPQQVYDPPSDQVTPLKGDPINWVNAHPSLTASDPIAVAGADSDWMGTRVDLSMSAKADREWVHLMPLSRAPAAAPLAITRGDDMFRWIVIYFDDADPLAIAAISPTADDPDLTAAVNELLASIDIEQK